LAVVQQHRNRNRDLLLRMAKHLVQARFEIEQVGGAIKSRHYRFERILLVQEAVFVRPDDAVGWKSKVCCHGINQVVRGEPGRPGWVGAERARSVVVITISTASPPRSTSTRWETYHRGDGPGHNGPSFTASFKVHTTRSYRVALVASVAASDDVKR